MLTLVSSRQDKRYQSRIQEKLKLETAIIHGLNIGKTYEEIAAQQFKSTTYIRNLASELMTLNGCRNARELLTLARESNFFTPQTTDNGS